MSGLVVLTVRNFEGAVLRRGVVALALLGTPLFAIMGGGSELLWLTHRDASYHHLPYIAANILTEKIAGSPIFVTITLFTFVGYVLAESKTAEAFWCARRARSSDGLPGGLAIVCVLASAIFTLFTGGSGVTIIAIGGLLYPALRKEGYSRRKIFSRGGHERRLDRTSSSVTRCR